MGIHVNINKSGHSHPIPKEAKHAFETFFHKCSFPDGNYTLKMLAAVHGTSHRALAGIQVKGLRDKNILTMFFLPKGENTEARNYSLIIGETLTQHFEKDPDEIFQTMKQIAEGAEIPKTPQEQSRQLAKKLEDLQETIEQRGIRQKGLETDILELQDQIQEKQGEIDTLELENMEDQETIEATGRAQAHVAQLIIEQIAGHFEGLDATVYQLVVDTLYKRDI
ncbi:MAG: hypothetical protein HOE80_04850 [Candidatus Magasanikbacteria bacterium]|nr:hypothetical protein [Candidatus Magasanikbacteria bacterium]MBT4072018.1 hypothetical protein [Candidatus Magasanikbacteria bacterium]